MKATGLVKYVLYAAWLQIEFLSLFKLFMLNSILFLTYFGQKLRQACVELRHMKHLFFL